MKNTDLRKDRGMISLIDVKYLYIFHNWNNKEIEIN